jgi:hypothetical protein
MPESNSIDKGMILVALIIAVGIIIAAFIVVSVGPSNTRNADDNVITLTVEAFADSMTVAQADDQSGIHSECSAADPGDVIKVWGEVVEVGCIDNDLEVGFVYSYLTLKEISSTGTDFFFLGNLTSDFQVGDVIEITLHVVERDGIYDTFWGDKVRLTGEFLLEDFYYGRYISVPMIPRNNVKTF